MENPFKNSFEKGPEQILTKEKVLDAISRFAEHPTFVRELSDNQGIYLLEVKVENKETNESVQYLYMRKGAHTNKNEASETAIHAVYYDGDVPVGGDKIAVYNYETEDWETV